MGRDWAYLRTDDGDPRTDLTVADEGDDTRRKRGRTGQWMERDRVGSVVAIGLRVVTVP